MLRRHPVCTRVALFTVEWCILSWSLRQEKAEKDALLVISPFYSTDVCMYVCMQKQKRKEPKKKRTGRARTRTGVTRTL